MPGLPIPTGEPASESFEDFRPTTKKPYIGISRERYIERLANGDVSWTSATDEEREEANALLDRIWR